MKKKSVFKWFKRTTLILGIIPILLFLAFAGAVSFIDFNQYKLQIEKEVSDYTGREFKIEGEVDVSVFPFELTATELVLKNPEGFESPNLLSVKAAQVELSLWSLLWNKEMNVLRLELLEPELHLIKNQTGNNWSDITGLAFWLPRSDTRMNTSQAAPQTATEWFESLKRVQVSLSPEVEAQTEVLNEVSQAEVRSNTDWAFDSLVVQNGKIQVYDKVQGFAETLLNINILTFDVVKDQPFDINSDFTYQNSLSQRMYDVHLNGTLEVKDSFTVWQLTQWNGVFKVRLPEDQQVPEIRLATRGELFEFDIATAEIVVENGFLSGLDAQLESSFSGRFGFDTLLSGTVTLKQLNFKEWATHLNIPLPKFVNQQALSVGNGQFEWHWDGDLLLLNKLDLKVDDSHITGGLSYELQGDQQVKFDVKIDNLNLDLYRAHVPQSKFLPPPISTGRGENLDTTPSNDLEAIASSETLIPIPISRDFLHTLNASGALSLTNVTAFDVQIDALNVELLAEQGVLELAPLDAKLYQGELLSRLTIDIAGERPAYHWKGRINQLDLTEIKVFPVLAGVMVSRFDLKTTGDQLTALKSQLKGKLSLNVTDAKVHGIDVNALLEGELNLRPSATAIQKMTVKGYWEEGVYSARKLDVRSERFSITGAGTFDLNSVKIDSGLILFVDRPTGGGDILKGLTIPVTYKGVLGAKNTPEQAVWTMNLVTLSLGTPEQKALLKQVGEFFKNAS